MKNEIYRVEAINNYMSLRLPQYDSLKILDDLMNTLDFQKSNEEMQKDIHKKYPVFREFERDFPSITFALATGVGKTILMAAFIAYLYTNHDIENFFIVAPNLTIYDKLINEFGNPSYKKYVFKRLNVFLQKPPLVITGDTYKDIANGQTSIDQSITINIFNIGKINSEVKGKNVPQIKRLSEYIGQSYFDYLAGLDDLVLLMDESHHYRADRGMAVINELGPLLGLELTATPQVEKAKGAVKFKNVVYEYSLANAIIDGFVKEPAAATRKNFDKSNFNPFEIDKIKLTDGIRIHRNTKTELEIYAKNEGVKVIKPFVLVVCKDTSHSEEIKEYIQSEDFYDGYYADKVIELHSNQKGNEKDENIQKLLSLEDEDNKIEIVIHVNMLKEGWDVTNLYTIIPLRTAVSLTLREQTIGRGLRLPYGERTGNAAVDRLTIVAHDKFEEIINAANEETSIIKQKNIIIIEDDEDMEKEKEIMSSKTVFDDYIEQQEKKKKYARSEEKRKEIDDEIKTARAVGLAIDEVLTNPINIVVPIKYENADGDNFSDKTDNQKTEVLKKIIKTEDLSKPEVIEVIKKKAKEKLEKDNGQITLFDIEKKIEAAVSPLIEQKLKYTIDIPDIAVIQVGNQIKVYEDFDLNTFWPEYDVPSEEIIIENLTDNEFSVLKEDTNFILPDSLPNIIINEILILESGISYHRCKDLLYKLANQVIDVVGKKKSQQELEKTIYHYKKDIARDIVLQMNSHSSYTMPEYQVKLLRSSTPILQQDYTKFKEDEIVKYTANIPAYEIKKKVVGYFSKACHTVYKFDSVPEHIFSIILERDRNVLKWLRPALGQFKIHYGSNRYNPDFVVETDKYIYIVEIKAHNRINDDEVKLKAKAARTYCNNVNLLYKGTENKLWKYILLLDSEIRRGVEFSYLEKEADMWSVE